MHLLTREEVIARTCGTPSILDNLFENKDRVGFGDIFDFSMSDSDKIFAVWTGLDAELCKEIVSEFESLDVSGLSNKDSFDKCVEVVKTKSDSRLVMVAMRTIISMSCIVVGRVATLNKLDLLLRGK